MKTCFCSIAFRNSDKNIQDIASFIAETGYDAIEVWGNHLTGGLAQVLDLKRRLQQHHLPVAMVSPYFDFTGSQEAWLRSLSTAKRFIQYSAVLKSPLIRVFTGSKGSAEVDRKTWTGAVEGLKAVTSLAEEKGIIMALETHPGTLSDTVDSTLQLISDVGSPNLGVNLDIYHFWDETGDTEIPIKALRPWIVHVHAKNTSLTAKERKRNPHLLLHDRQAAQEFYGISSMAGGHLPYETFFRSLFSNGFSRYVSVEWFGEDVELAAKNELLFLRSMGTTLESEKLEVVQSAERSSAGQGNGAHSGEAPIAVTDAGSPAIEQATSKAAEAIKEAFAAAKKSRKKQGQRKKKVSDDQLSIELGRD